MNLILSERSSTLPLLVPMLSSVSRDGAHYSTSAEDVTVGNLIMTLDSLRFIVASGKFARSLNSNMRFGASIQLVARSRKRGGGEERKREKDDCKKRSKRRNREEKRDRTWRNRSAHKARVEARTKGKIMESWKERRSTGDRWRDVERQYFKFICATISGFFRFAAPARPAVPIKSEVCLAGSDVGGSSRETERGGK